MNCICADTAGNLRPAKLVTETVVVAGKTRSYLVYVPPRTGNSTSGIMFFCPDGITALQAYDNSAWRVLAGCDDAKDQFVVAFLEPEDGKWNLNEEYGCPDGDVAFAMAVHDQMKDARRNYCVHEAMHYLFGVGTGGVMAHMTAMWDPAVFSGVASVGGSAVAPEYMDKARKAMCTDFHGFVDETCRLGVKKSEIPLPAWVVEDPDSPVGTGSVAEYWRGCCGADQTARQIAPDTWEYTRSAQTLHPEDQNREAYRVRVSYAPNAAHGLADSWYMRIWKGFLSKQRRWEGNAGGDLRCTVDPVADLGAQYHCEKICGFMREWYTYVPESVRENPETPVPLVFAMHGYSCSGAIYIGHSGWCDVADKYGFIVVFPSATEGFIYMPEKHTTEFMPLPAWNFLGIEGKPDELLFFRELYERICGQFCIDRSRVYATGHSHGSMMTHTLGLISTDMFAAIAPCSGTMFELGNETSILEFPAVKARKDCQLPVWMFVGEEEPWLIPSIPTNENKTGRAIACWRDVNHLSPTFPESWDKGWSVHDGWHDIVYSNDDNEPRVRYTWMEAFPHAVCPRMAFRIWEEFFSKYRRVSGEVVWCGS